MTSWKNSKLTWFITGAASGFGLELTRLALANGHNVIATSRNPAKVPELVSEIEGKGGRWLTLDVDDPNGGLVIDKLEEEGTGIDILVNNAGWSIHGPVESFPEDEVRRQMETVYFGPYRLIRAVLPHMRQRRQGLILNIGSGAGVGGRESMGIYAAAKAAMDGNLLCGLALNWKLTSNRPYKDPCPRGCSFQHPYLDSPTWRIRYQLHQCSSSIIIALPTRLSRRENRSSGSQLTGKQLQSRR